MDQEKKNLIEGKNEDLPRIEEMILEKDEDLVFFGTCHCNSKT